MVKEAFTSLGDFKNTVKRDALGLIDRGKKGGKPKFNPGVLINPKKYATKIEIDKIIADTKYSRQGVEYYKEKIRANQPIDPIVVVKHPRKDLYAVLDGHHRYYAYRGLGKETISCAVAREYSTVLFYLTEQGYLQPKSGTTEHLRRPIKKMHGNLKQFLDDFLDEQKIKQELERIKAERVAKIEQLKKEIKNARSEQKAKLQAKIDKLEEKRQKKIEHAKQRLEQIKKENDAKVQALREKIKI